ncbi:MAG: hypothetical protein EZS28_026608 [Streblomastix strix]|uniref:Uncharacterized protein n=1 Tax=Streblomastix strix TaxID=222440 RepID=A0A5J4V4L7_9EUKA|nr:MAG: hypothetical protein EZS28_026608 [Streblomastix strix]
MELRQQRNRVDINIMNGQQEQPVSLSSYFDENDPELHSQLEKERQIKFDKNDRLRTNSNPNHVNHKWKKDIEVNENQIERRSELKNSISLILSEQNTQTNPNIDLNYISPKYNTSLNPSSSHLQQHSASPSLEDTLAILNSIPPRDPRGHKEKEPEPKQPKLQQHAGLMGVIEIFHEIMEPIIEEEKEETPKDNGDNDQSEHTIEPKLFTTGNDRLGKNDSGTQLQTTVNGEANLEINITKTSAKTPPHNINESDGLGGNGCGTQLQAATNDNGHENHQAIDNTGNEDNNEQVNDNRIGGQQQLNNQESNNETRHQQDSVNDKPGEIGSPHTTHSEQELRNSNTSQPKGQPPLITKPPELGQVKEKVVVPKQKTQQVNEHDTRSRTGQPKSVPDKSLGSLEATANSDTLNHFTPQQKQRKKADIAQVTVDKSAKHSKGNKTSVGSKKQKQGFNSDNQIEIEPDSETDEKDQLD